MNLTKRAFADYINDFRLKELFIDMGWDNDRTQIPPMQIGDVLISPRIIADKNGFKIIECRSPDVPLHNILVQAANTIRKLFNEHLTIFCDEKMTNKSGSIVITIIIRTRKQFSDGARIKMSNVSTNERRE
jgi:hypothetical protein